MAKKVSGRARIEADAEKLAAPIAEKHGVYIYDVDYVKEGDDQKFFQVDQKTKPVSRELSDRLDEVDLISDAYTLVVSSPGLGRALTKDRHLENSIGEKVEGKLFKALAETGSKEFEGILLSWDAETVTIEMEPVQAKARRKKKGKPEQEEQAQEPAVIHVPRKDIAVLRLYLDI